MSEQAFSAIGLTSYPLSSEDELLTNAVTGASVRAPKGTGARLDACRSFRGLEEHERRLRGGTRMAMDAGAALAGPNQLCTALERLRDHGLLVGFATFLDWLHRPASSLEHADGPAGPQRITALMVPTCDRPALLRRNLSGFLHHARSHDRRLRVIVADQSRKATDRELTRAALREEAAEYGHRAFYVGPEEVASYIGTLSQYLGSKPETVAFALADPLEIGFAAGANRNALLLASIDELALSVDDDMVCRVGGPLRGWSRGRVLALAGSATPAWCTFPTRAAVLDAVPEQSWDALAQAESVLGSPVADCLARYGAAAVRTESLDAQSLQGVRGAVVRVAAFGITGDAGTPAGRRAVLALDGELRERLTADDDTYRTAATGREVHRVAACTTIYTAPQCMAGAVALDRRIAGAPFLPVRAGEDSVFALVLRLAYPAAIMAEVPCSFLHAPEGERAVDDAFLDRSAATPCLAEVLESCLTLSRPSPFTADPTRRLRRLGESLFDLAQLHAPEFWQVVRRERWRRVSADIARLEGLLDRYDRRPAVWARDVDHYCTTARKAAATEEFYTPRDLLGGRTPPEARTCCQSIVRNFATLLALWPDVIQAASELRQRGVSLEAPA